ncbi:galactose-3-O-sulfotransferase 2-like [Ptychodera flava]|uniref:galactose-3-O-sulfotransferase 2-like n=1 Tax=Ptychodera flava TaxID=63121 RepID=UPI003969FAF3
MKKGQILKIMVTGTIFLGLFFVYRSFTALSHMDRNRGTSLRESVLMWITDITEQPTLETVTEEPESPEPCKPKKNLVMMKTHKSGSSTLQNILLRYADKHNLTVVLPISGHQLNYPSKFNRNNAIAVPWKEYNIFTHHTRFNLPEIMKVMANDTVYTTILRDPVTQFESLFNYYKLGNYLNIRGPNPLRVFLNEPEKFNKPSMMNRYLKNNFMYDLGYTPLQKNKTTDEIIQKIDSIFDLVLISEYFDQSLILLRYLMCWDMDDLVYFSVNARKQTSVKTLTPWMEGRISEWNAADVQLYQYFNRSFWQRVRDFGEERMEKEVWALRERVQIYWDMCIEGTTENGEGVWHLRGVQVQSYTLKHSAENKTVCQQMTKPEIPFTRELATKLRARVKDYHKRRSQHILQ